MSFNKISFRAFKKFSGGGGVESDYSVCPRQDGLSGNPVYIS